MSEERSIKRGKRCNALRLLHLTIHNLCTKNYNLSNIDPDEGVNIL